MKSNYAIGIDLGTSTSEICIYKNNEPLPIPDPITKIPIIPSIVAINERGKLLVGETARGIVDRKGFGVRESKRNMGTDKVFTLREQDYRPEEIAALILRKLKENAEEALGHPIQDVVISVPANFPDAARKATFNAGEIAGLNVLRLLNEPTAAALAFGIKNIASEEQLVVFDFGGGTLDISVLEMFEGVLDVKSSFGDPQLGGKDFDAVMISLLLQKFAAQYPEVAVENRETELKGQAEQAKKTLSIEQSCDVRIPYFATKDGKGIDLDIEITRTEFEQAIEPLLERARICIREALNAKKIRPSAIDRVLLVGGTTYIPAVRNMVAEMFGKQPKLDVNPDLAVGIGACIQAALAQGLINEENGIILTDVAPFGLGIDVVSMIGGQVMLTYEPLIERNTTIPYSVKKTYTLLHAEQQQVEVRLYQDHTGKARLPGDTQYTGISGEITDIPPAPNGNPYPIEIEFSYDINGMAKLTASIPDIRRSIEFAFGHSNNRMSQQETRVSTERIESLWKRHERAKQYESLINKAERFMAGIPPQERSPLSRAVMDLKEALTTDNSTNIDAAGDRLIDMMFAWENQ
ncbi:Hsp70 family protein [Nodularia spumigena CS-584]|uniref:Hsp70 family protein n=1 Tax=Nodularia spumigena TaxID=70799 RepID=UPI0000EAC848|nr:Hsp70 family protein [Nodularia spumigena]AHJ29737.1 Chaperone protein DnaK [Nodularia spumigena CCY9414]EAW44025.1 DnaK protein [Nodularia spumigena CCY9414]MDB9382215.1 Hsp70 family protein [Nodularia spumigena CS-584]